MKNDIELDMRDREPPEPLFETLYAVDAAAPGDVIRLRIHREPLMLYPHLQKQDVPFSVENYGSPDWVIRIGPMPDGHGQR
ncbi:MAG TPA: DUF2249 domain-containing protein [Gammaproteobacteria bacterium]